MVITTREEKINFSVGYESGDNTVRGTMKISMEETFLKLTLNIHENWDQQGMG